MRPSFYLLSSVNAADMTPSPVAMPAPPARRFGPHRLRGDDRAISMVSWQKSTSSHICPSRHEGVVTPGCRWRDLRGSHPTYHVRCATAGSFASPKVSQLLRRARARYHNVTVEPTIGAPAPRT